jgi:membrane protease YdiL (CAAX protease family)
MGLIVVSIVLLRISALPRGGRPDGAGVVGFMLLAIVLAPLEEWVFRGVILQRLVKPLGATAALLLSSAVFALAHGWMSPPYLQFFSHFVGGLVLGAVYLRTGLLWPPTVLHGAYNITWFTALYLLTSN